MSPPNRTNIERLSVRSVFGTACDRVTGVRARIELIDDFADLLEGQIKRRLPKLGDELPGVCFVTRNR
jgi:hypothetical protein